MTSTTPQEEECRAKENLASILHNIKAMPAEDQLGMIEVLFEKESTVPAWIRARQVGSIKPITKGQVRKNLWQLSAEEQKEIGLLFRQSLKSQEMSNPIQIHMLQIPKKQEGLSLTRVRAVKIKLLTKKQVKEKWQRHGYKDLKEITLKALKGIPNNQLMPRLQKLRSSVKT